jgi:hypothetical protein
MLRKFTNSLEEHIYVINRDPLNSMYQKLSMVGQIFIQDLRREYQHREAIRKYNEDIKYDCKIIQNEGYVPLNLKSKHRNSLLREYNLYEGSTAQ